MCRYKCQCCGPCFCCKDNVETAFILGIAYIVLNALFFELLGLGITDGNPTLWIYFESCKIIHPIQHAVLIYGAHKRSTTTILIWIILTAVILTAHVISGVLAPGIIDIFVPFEEGNEQQLASNAILMTTICIFVATANIWALVVSWKARKEIIDVYKQEDPAELDKMENIAEISSTIQP